MPYLGLPIHAPVLVRALPATTGTSTLSPPDAPPFCTPIAHPRD
ncbi:MAG: hypothetical protein ACLFVO_19400 [Chloroflexaceae bacterium]